MFGYRYMIYYFLTDIFNMNRLCFNFSTNNIYIMSFSIISFAANSIEREIYDLFGICFYGNDTLTRMFTD